MPRILVAGGEGGTPPVQSSPSLQSCLSGASELPSMTFQHHSQQQHTRPSASVTVARIIWWPLSQCYLTRWCDDSGVPEQSSVKFCSAGGCVKSTGLHYM